MHLFLLSLLPLCHGHEKIPGQLRAQGEARSRLAGNSALTRQHQQHPGELTETHLRPRPDPTPAGPKGLWESTRWPFQELGCSRPGLQGQVSFVPCLQPLDQGVHLGQVALFSKYANVRECILTLQCDGT